LEEVSAVKDLNETENNKMKPLGNSFVIEDDVKSASPAVQVQVQP